MNFLLSYMRPRKTVSSLPNQDSDEPQDIVDDDGVAQIQENETEEAVEVDIVATNPIHLNFKGGRKVSTTKRKTEDETASSVLMQYLISKQEAEQRPQARNPTDTFLNYFRKSKAI